MSTLSQGKADGSIFVWNTLTGKLALVLEGPLEKIADLTWHPHLNVLISVAAGKVWGLSISQVVVWFLG